MDSQPQFDPNAPQNQQSYPPYGTSNGIGSTATPQAINQGLPTQPTMPTVNASSQLNTENQGQYDFFLNPKASQKPKGSLIKNNNKLIYIIGGVLVLILLIMIGSSLIPSTPGASAAFTTLDEQQEELIHITTSATNQASQTAAANLAVNIQLSMTTAQQQLTSYLTSIGTKVGSKQLVSLESPSIDTQLSTAVSQSNFDQVFSQIVENQLTAYMNTMIQAAKTAGPRGRQLLKKDYSGAKLLLQQTKATIAAINASNS